MKFINQEKPLLEQSAKLLLKEKSRGKLPFDLTHISIIVPNLQACRMLRGTLSYYSFEYNSKVRYPDIYTPKNFLKECLKKLPNIASSEQMKWAWSETLCQVSRKRLIGFLPKLPAKRNLLWAIPIADILIGVRNKLMTNGWIFRTAYQKIKPLGWDQNRWETWVYLEEVYLNKLKQNKWNDPVLELLKCLETDGFSMKIPYLILIGCPNLSPLLEKCLEKLSQQSEIDIWFYATTDEKKGFSRWGRPLKEYWNNLSQDLKLDSKIVNFYADSDSLAKAVGNTWRKENWKNNQVALGLLDSDIKFPLTVALEGRDHFFDPSDKKDDLRPWLYPLHIWKELDNGDLEVFIEWAFQTFIKKQWQGDACTETWLKDFYKCQQKYKLYTLKQAYLFLTNHKKCLMQPFQLLDEFQFKYHKQGVFAFIKSTWQHIYDSSSEKVKSYNKVMLEAINLIEKQLSPYIIRIKPQETLTFVLNCLSSIQIKEENSNEKVSLSGWLDLLWNPAPKLVLLGLDEGNLASNDNLDYYLPESLQSTLGLSTSSEQYAINAYILKKILSSRKTDQQQIWLSKTSTSGEPIKPARYLFHGKREDLADRTKLLFETNPQLTSIPINSWKGEWTKPICSAIKKISVTHFADFLQCPFRFYLKNILGMEKPDDRKWEMDPRDYGTLFHQALEEYYKNLKSGVLFSEKLIQDFFNNSIEKIFIDRFGNSQNTVIQIQKHSLLQRLRSGIPILLERILQGWKVEAIEKPFKETHIVSGENIEISGKIDLIESHPEEGIHLIDFKTFEKSTSPIEKHLRKLSSKDKDYPSWQVAVQGDSSSIWIDLQIPMYINHLKEIYPNRKIQAGYLVFPAAISETRFLNWDNLSQELLNSASVCREGVLRKIIQGEFQPIRETLTNDSFKELIEKGAFKNLS